MVGDPGKRSKIVFVAVVACLLALNLVVLAAAYPETMRVDSGCCSTRTLAKDFSAFYTAAWRFVHDPGQIYTPGFVNDGEYHVLPQPESYKYLPSFLLMMLPFLSLPYQQALTAFDILQFLLLPLVAYFVYELTKEKGIAVAVVIAIIALLLPSPGPHSNLSVAYFWQWAEGQSKVLETFLLLLSFYLGKGGRPVVSGAVFALTAFDPRFTLLSVPLLVMYNRKALKSSIAAGTAVFLATNAVLFYPATASGFLRMLVTDGLGTPLYFYALIPFLTVLALTALNAEEIGDAFRKNPIN